MIAGFFTNSIYLIAMICVWVAFTLFFLLNVNRLIRLFSEARKNYFLETSSFLNQIRYFSFTQKNVKNIRYISSCLIGLVAFAILADTDVFIMGSIFGLIIGYFAPDILLNVYRNSYVKALNRQLVPSMDIVATSMQAGLNLPQALKAAADAIDEPIRKEFTIITRQLRLGMTLEDALSGFAERIPLADVNLIIKSMTISIKMGTNLPTALRKIADTIKKRKEIKAKIEVLTAQGRAQGIVVGALPIGLAAVLFIMDHSFVTVLTETMIGKGLIGLMIALEIIAFFVIKRIVTIEI